MTKVALADDRQDLAPSSMDTGRRPGMASGYDRVFADKTLASASPRTSDFVRRLRAIAVIDVVDYSRMMASEEALTHARVNALFAAVVEPAIEKHSGRRIERAGDGLIVLFESSTDAVRCALAIHAAPKTTVAL
jgi:class 3 adenylate cyclase